jgi:folate-dependent phosphoribosylglycinamide formyltransferase PurN
MRKLRLFVLISGEGTTLKTVVEAATKLNILQLEITIVITNNQSSYNSNREYYQ